MKATLMDYFQAMFTERAIRKMARFISEKPDSVKESFVTILPMIIGKLADKCVDKTEDVQYIKTIAILANKNKYRYSTRHIPLEWEQLEKSEMFLNYLFGDSRAWSDIAEDIAQRCQIRLFSAIVLMQILTPICLSNLGRNILEYDMTMEQVPSFLLAQQRELEILANEAKYKNQRLKEKAENSTLLLQFLNAKLASAFASSI